MTKVNEKLKEILTERGITAMELCNDAIALMENANEQEALEIIAAISSAYSSVKAGYVVCGIVSGMGEAYMMEMLNKIDATEASSFRELMQVISAIGRIPNPMTGSTDTIQ